MNKPILALEAAMDEMLVKFTHKEMERKLTESRSKGRYGWFNDTCSNVQLKELLLRHIEKGDFIDVVNFAAMIHYRKKKGIEPGCWPSTPMGGPREPRSKTFKRNCLRSLLDMPTRSSKSWMGRGNERA